MRWAVVDRLRWLRSPILNRELRVLLRSARSFIWLALYLIVLAAAFMMAWSRADPTNRDLTARELFYSIVATQMVFFNLLAPILTAGSL
ncbi:hypothetical protein FJY63_06185, partial [Candidatus Sumerlaeota bacterium]|nr:hypothetical protein [Candidatus Sumerlaeota bacterium]